MYTTNIIEGVNRQYRKATKNKSVFPNDASLAKCCTWQSQNVMKKWTRWYRGWDQVDWPAHPAVRERLTQYL